jgi:transketolase
METLADSQVADMEAVAHRLRGQIVDMFALAGGGHYGGSLSVVEILVTLYGAVLRVDSQRPDWPDRDRLVLSKGHAAGALCTVLAHYGYYDEALLDTFNQLDSPFGMHPDMNKICGCDMSTGSLGHGLPVGMGMAVAGRADGKDYRVYVVMGDGECNEGTVWEAASVAAHLKLDRLVAVVDRNHLSLDGETEALNPVEPLADRWRAFGWHVIEVADGHDVRQLYAALQKAQSVKGQPAVIIADTIKGKGLSFMEGRFQYHYAFLSEEDLRTARSELGREVR